jgi:ATP-dependent RNA helicase RhlE
LTSFNDFGLSEPITRALADERYVTPTPIQVQTIPSVRAGRDVVGIAQTGTGKTAAFALPILEHLVQNRLRPQRRGCRVLVLSPTRELSAQIADSFRTYGRHLHLKVALAIGGVPINRQSRELANGVDVLVATPGRLLDLAENDGVRLQYVEVFVLDEADQMLDMGFIPAIRQIVRKIPAKRQNLFFSATMPQAISELAGQLLRDPVQVAVTPVASTVERVDQRVVHVDRGSKAVLLADSLKKDEVERALVFARTKHGADKIVRNLAHAGISAAAIHGNKSQNERDRVLAGFRDGRIRTLVATDIAARGIDVTGVSHVFNYDLPQVPESYVHRIGRTARAGAEGIAVSFCDAEERPLLRAIEKLIRLAIPATTWGRGSIPAAGHEAAREPRRAAQGHRPHRGEPGRAAKPQRDEFPRNGKRRRRGGGGSANAGRPEGQPARQPHHNGEKSRPIAATQPIGAQIDATSIGFLQRSHGARRDRAGADTSR